MSDPQDFAKWEAEVLGRDLTVTHFMLAVLALRERDPGLPDYYEEPPGCGLRGLWEGESG